MLLDIVVVVLHQADAAAGCFLAKSPFLGSCNNTPAMCLSSS